MVWVVLPTILVKYSDMSETRSVAPDLTDAATQPSSLFNRDVDALLLDIAHRNTLSGKELEEFWAELRGIMGDQASQYQLHIGTTDEGRFAVLAPKVPQE